MDKAVIFTSALILFGIKFGNHQPHPLTSSKQDKISILLQQHQILYLYLKVLYLGDCSLVGSKLWLWYGYVPHDCQPGDAHFSAADLTESLPISIQFLLGDQPGYDNIAVLIVKVSLLSAQHSSTSRVYRVAISAAPRRLDRASGVCGGWIW